MRTHLLVRSSSGEGSTIAAVVNSEQLVVARSFDGVQALARGDVPMLGDAIRV